MSQGFARAFDEGIFGTVINACLFEGPQKLLSLAASGCRVVGESIDATLAGVGGAMRGVVDRANQFSLSGSTQETGQKCGRSAAFYNAPEVAAVQGPNHADIREIGCLAAQAWNVAPAKQSAGIGVD